MGLRCMLGHDFDEPHVERDREEDGNEVVVTVREVKACTRCGEERVVSENKEVTSIFSQSAEATSDTSADAYTPVESPATDVAGAGELADAKVNVDATQSRGATAASTDGSSAEANERTGADSTGGGVVDPADGANADPADETEIIDGSADGESDAIPAAETDEFTDIDAEEDDGIILDDEDEAPHERGHGEWPDSSDVGAAAETDEPTPWPEQTGEDEGFSAEMSDDEPLDVKFGGLAPEAEPTDDGPREGYDAEFVGNDAEVASENDDGFVRAEEANEIGEGTPTEYYCPACEMTRLPTNSSMRPGDICPECQRGYVTERER